MQNGNAEAPVVTAGTVPGWTSVAGSTWGIYTKTICPDCPAAFDGQQYFFAGAVASGELAQDVDVTSYSASIDRGLQSFAFSVNVSAYNQVPTDGSRTIVEYRDGAGNILSTFDSAEIRSINTWILVSDVRRAPPGTRRIRIRLLAIRHNGTNNDGYFDGVALRPASTEFPSGESLALNGPAGLAVGPDGSVYVADRNNHRVVRFRPDGSAAIVAGTGEAGFGGDEGPATSASLSSPTSVAIGSDGSVHIADLGNQRIRRVAVDGTIGTVAGTGAVGYSGDGGPAVDALFYDPIAVAVGPDGSVYVAERSNHVVRRIVPDGSIETVAGTAFPGYNGDGGPAKQAQLNRPSGVAVASDGTLYIADDFNHRAAKRARPAVPCRPSREQPKHHPHPSRQPNADRHPIRQPRAGLERDPGHPHEPQPILRRGTVSRLRIERDGRALADHDVYTRRAGPSPERNPGGGDDQEECAGLSEISQRVEAYLKRPVFAPATRADTLLEGTVEAQPAGGWRVRIRMLDRDGRSLGRRDLVNSTADCRETSEAAALALALMIDPTASSEADDASALPMETRTTPAVAPDAATRAVPASAPPRKGLADATRPDLGPSQSWHAQLALGVATSVNQLPAPSLGMEGVAFHSAKAKNVTFSARVKRPGRAYDWPRSRRSQKAVLGAHRGLICWRCACAGPS